MKLRPSDIRYSQRSISNTFCDGDLIGEVLDDICDGYLRKRDIPMIEVAKYGRKWYTADNRRLWVFRALEDLDMCWKIPVIVIDEIPSYKMTTRCRGDYVHVRGHPGGFWVRRLDDY